MPEPTILDLTSRLAQLRQLLDAACLCEGCAARYREVTGEPHRKAEVARLEAMASAAYAARERIRELERKMAEAGACGACQGEGVAGDKRCGECGGQGTRDEQIRRLTGPAMRAPRWRAEVRRLNRQVRELGERSRLLAVLLREARGDARGLEGCGCRWAAGSGMEVRSEYDGAAEPISECGYHRGLYEDARQGRESSARGHILDQIAAAAGVTNGSWLGAVDVIRELREQVARLELERGAPERARLAAIETWREAESQRWKPAPPVPEDAGSPGRKIDPEIPF